MYLKYMQIRNYKNLEKVCFKFSRGINTVIGENDSGKSNAMTALRILLDDDFYYNTKRLKETDFYEELDDWRGHWIIISAFFDEISSDDKSNEVCAEMISKKENENFLRSYIRCRDTNYGVVTLFIRPNRTIRKKLFEVSGTKKFEEIRKSITLGDYEFYYTTRSQADFTDDNTYNELVGNLSKGICPDPENTDSEVTGVKTDITDVWKYISLEFIDALRDASSELHKPRNPLRRIFDAIQADFDSKSVEHVMEQIHILNEELSSMPEIKDIGGKINEKLEDIVGLVYSPGIGIASHMQEELSSVAKHLALVPSSEENIEQLGLGHLNILYIALKLVEFEYYRNHEILNIMVIEEPEAHIHTHIQRTLFEKLNVSTDYTQVIMTTHSTYLSEVSNIKQMNVLKRQGKRSIVMDPVNGLEKYGEDVLKQKISMETCLERYLDAKRSVLLFSKGVILVEGDGEEILIPALIEKGLGVSLDELGIGLINVGSVAFEYIASIFSEDRLQRYCAIITDSDSVVDGEKKRGSKAEKLGVSRRNKLDRLFRGNPYVEAIYAPHTLEIDFYNEDANRQYIKTIINTYYSDRRTIKRYIEAIDESEASRCDSVKAVLSNKVHKGWHAIQVAAIMDNTVSIPEYILSAITFAAQEVLTPTLLKKITLYILSTYDNTNNLINALGNSYKDEEILNSIHEAIDNTDNINLRRFISKWEELCCDKYSLD